MIDIAYDTTHIIYKVNDQIDAKAISTKEVRSITFVGSDWAWDLAVTFIETLGRSYQKMDRLKETSLIEEVESSFKANDHSITFSGPWGDYIHPEIISILKDVLKNN